jgi:hypothetical protein
MGVKAVISDERKRNKVSCNSVDLSIVIVEQFCTL